MKSFLRTYFVLALAVLAVLSSPAQDNTLLMARAKLMQGDNEAAVELLGRILQEKGDDKEILFLRGTAFYGSGIYDKAITDILAGRESDPAGADLYLARCYAGKGDAGNSVLYLGRHLASPGRLREKEIMLDPAFSGIENSMEWRGLWKTDWYTPFEREKAAIVYLAKNSDNYHEALSRLNILLDQKDDDPGLYELRALVHESGSMYRKALADMLRAIELSGGMPAYRQRKISLLGELGMLDMALEESAGLLKEHPEMFGLLPERAAFYERKGEHAEAAAEMKSYLAWFPGDKEAIYLAGTYSYRSGDFYSSLSYMNGLLEKGEEEKDHYMLRALSYLGLNTPAYAEKDFSMALDLDPADPAIYLGRAKARLKMKDHDAACFDLNKAFKMGEKQALSLLQDHCGY